MLHRPFGRQNTTRPVLFSRLGILGEIFGQRAEARHPRLCRTPFPAKDRTLRLSVSFLLWMGLRVVDAGSYPELRTYLPFSEASFHYPSLEGPRPHLPEYLPSRRYGVEDPLGKLGPV